MTTSIKVTQMLSSRSCPECKRKSVRPFYPFCSRRCKDIDLNRWLTGRYVIPASDDETSESDLLEAVPENSLR